MFYYFKHLFLLRNTACLTEKNGILMHLVLCTMPLYYLSEQPDVATGREHGSGFVLPGQAAQRKASRGDARQGKPSRCVGQARRERCPLVLKNTVDNYTNTLNQELNEIHIDSEFAQCRDIRCTAHHRDIYLVYNSIVTCSFMYC